MDNNNPGVPSDPSSNPTPSEPTDAPTSDQPAEAPAANQSASTEEKCSTCGNQAAGGNCVPCGQPAMSCVCPPASAGGDQGTSAGPSPV